MGRVTLETDERERRLSPDTSSGEVLASNDPDMLTAV
jgi:hypothetical protein